MKKYLLPLIFILNFVLLQNLNGQDLRTKIGQMIIVGFSGSTTITDSLKYDLQNLNLGGVIVYSSNLKNPAQILKLCDTVKKYAQTPPFIAIDQEGGRVARLNKSNGFDSTYTAYRLGTFFNNEDTTRNLAIRMAGWLKQCGNNLNFAPVADVNVNPLSPAIGKLERSYSKYPIDVFKHSKIFIDAFNSQNIITTLKHFPGHGSAASDSHLGFTDITNTWADSELVPFRNLIATGYKDFIMSGHLFNHNLDTVYPATLSKLILTNKLRNEMQFQGLVITDDLFMQAISNNYTFEESIELAINAGNDILLFSTNLKGTSSLPHTIIDLVMSKISEGKISQSTIEQSYQRIIDIKRRYSIMDVDENLDRSAKPLTAELYQNFPNPVFQGNNASSTIIKYSLNEPTHVTLAVFNQLGQQIEQLVQQEQNAGYYSVNFHINRLASGIYFYRLTTDKTTITKKLVIIK